MNEFIDIYCERLGPGLWAEPLNALTNAAFFIAAVLAYLLARKENKLDWRSGILIGLVAIIGTGSTLFHTIATFWAMLTDSIPILIYQIVFIALYARRVMGWEQGRIFILLGLFFSDTIRCRTSTVKLAQRINGIRPGLAVPDRACALACPEHITRTLRPSGSSWRLYALAQPALDRYGALPADTVRYAFPVAYPEWNIVIPDLPGLYPERLNRS
ncbi:MAG: ceramidase domain-containing protein [Alphaproteobacteria bacterium]|nr:ceramidase domain-containing protein [Alphaproteobacteria bacterium]